MLLQDNLQGCSNNLREALEKISATLNHDVGIVSIENDWVRFRVVGLTDWAAAAHIDLEKDRIFGADVWKYQVLCSSQAPHGEGVWIQELTGSKQGECQAGVRQY